MGGVGVFDHRVLSFFVGLFSTKLVPVRLSCRARTNRDRSTELETAFRTSKPPEVTLRFNTFEQKANYVPSAAAAAAAALLQHAFIAHPLCRFRLVCTRPMQHEKRTCRCEKEKVYLFFSVTAAAAPDSKESNLSVKFVTICKAVGKLNEE